MNITAIQMHSTTNVGRNLQVAYDLMSRAVMQEADWVILPEHFHWAGGTDSEKLAAAELLPGGPAYKLCQDFARANSVYIHAGSIFERIPGEDRVFNTTVAFDQTGKEVARYRKTHLFDITAPDGAKHHESSVVRPGDTAVVYNVDDITIGCAICYDIRFPDLFQALLKKGADVIALPAAFNPLTGKAHWEALLRARAIETQSYIVASGSVSAADGSGGRKTYGHSMIVDPWGQVLEVLPTGDGLISSKVDVSLLKKVRMDMPVASHRRRDLYDQWDRHG